MVIIKLLKIVLRCGGENGYLGSRMDAIILNMFDQLFTVDTIWNIGETGDIIELKEAEIT